MIYRKTYNFSSEEIKEKFLNRTINPTYFNKIRMNWSAEMNKRVYFGKLDNCRLDLYSWPDRLGPWFSKPWIFPWRGMSMWAAPAHAYGTIYNSKNETIIDYCIKKNKWIKRYLIFGYAMCTLVLVPVILQIFKYELLEIVYLLVIMSWLLSLLIATGYIPKSEKKALIEFLNDLEV